MNRPRILIGVLGAFGAGVLFRSALDYLDQGRTGLALMDMSVVAIMALAVIIQAIIISRPA